MNQPEAFRRVLLHVAAAFFGAGLMLASHLIEQEIPQKLLAMCGAVVVGCNLAALVCLWGSTRPKPEPLPQYGRLLLQSSLTRREVEIEAFGHAHRILHGIDAQGSHGERVNFLTEQLASFAWSTCDRYEAGLHPIAPPELSATPFDTDPGRQTGEDRT